MLCVGKDKISRLVYHCEDSNAEPFSAECSVWATSYSFSMVWCITVLLSLPIHHASPYAFYLIVRPFHFFFSSSYYPWLPGWLLAWSDAFFHLDLRAVTSLEILFWLGLLQNSLTCRHVTRTEWGALASLCARVRVCARVRACVCVRINIFHEFGKVCFWLLLMYIFLFSCLKVMCYVIS
jgi:hypothetical protein